VEKAHWFSMARTFPAEYSWVANKPVNRIEKEYDGIKYWDGYYEHNGTRYVPSWGGSMFEALMPGLFINERKFAPEGLGANNEAHVRVSIDYALNELKYPVWGMSPCSNPDGGYKEYGVKPLGSMGYNSEAVTPHASFLALEYAPAEALDNIRTMLEKYAIYGEYGFYDSFDPKTGKVAYKYLSLDQGMILLALDNYLNDNAIRKRFENDPIFQKGKELLTAEKFFKNN
jgi:hypothetical protein